MADQLAKPEDLASLLERDDVDLYKATRLVEIATAVVQAACGRPPQRLVRVLGDTATLIGGTGQWLELPQRPVTAVASVSLDGTALSAGTATGTYRFRGGQLWRREGWTACPYEPSEVIAVYDHGYEDSAQDLELAAAAVLGICQGAYGNPTGLKAETIDDYSATYAVLSAQLEATPYLHAALRRQYGRPSGVVAYG